MAQYAQVRTETTIKHYGSQGAMQRGIRHMAGQGWTVSGTMENQHRSGCLRFVLLGGIGAILFPKKATYTVTFQR